MDFRSSFPTFREEEEQGEDIKVSVGEETVSTNKIRIIMVKGGDDDDDSFEEQHHIKVEVADIPTFQSDDENYEAGVQFGEIQVKTEPLNIKPPSLPTSEHNSEPNQSRRRKKESNTCRTCPHCPFKSYNTRIYKNHLRAHLPGSPARVCQECKCFVFPQNLKCHRADHRRNAWKKRVAELKIKNKMPPDPLGPNSMQEQNSEDDDDDDLPVVVKTEETQEVVDLGHISASTFFESEDEEIKTEPNFILPHLSSNLEWESVPNNNEHRCPLCPYTSYSMLSVQTHLKVHENGVTSVPCKNCGVHNLPKKRCSCYHHQYVPKKKIIPKPNGKKEPEWLTSPDFTVFKKESKHYYNIITLRCHYCPFTVKNNVAGMKKHIKLHDPTSQAVPCSICGAYVLPERMKSHHGLRHLPQLPKALRNKMNKRKRKPKLDFTVEIKKGTRWCICRKCPYKTIRRGEIDTHAELHLEGSSAIPCKLCSVFLLPEHAELHQATDHPVLQHEKPTVKKKVPVILKCPHCPHEVNYWQHFEGHAALHLEGSGAIPCPDCDVYYLPNPVTSRHRCGKWKMMKRLRLLKAKRSVNQNDSSSQLPVAE